MFIRNCPKCSKEIIYKSKETFNKAELNKALCSSCSRKIIKTEFFKKCPSCEKVMYYKNNVCLEHAIKINSVCISCGKKNNKKEKKYERTCPKCNNIIKYTNKSTMKKAEKNNTLCYSCRNKITFNRDDIKKHFKDKFSGKNNPMYGKSVLDIWEEKYGKEIKDKKYVDMIEKCRIASSGKNNAMYGKPSPIGSGNGWNGWYKNIHFRSILELSYIKYLIDNNISFESGEKKSHKISYVIDDKEHNYFPDFYLINTEEIIEIKPYNLINSKINLAKFEAGRKLYGDKFKVITDKDIIKLNFKDIYNMYYKNEIKFAERYEKKFNEIIKDGNFNKIK